MVAADALTAEDARSMLLSAAEKRDQEPDSIIEAIRFLERERSKESGEADGETTKFNQLTTNGNWRLVFTTGDLKTQKKLGGNKISYVPIKAVQVFNADYTITNGVYLGSFPLLKFFGTFTWDEGRSRLEFTFNEVEPMTWSPLVTPHAVSCQVAVLGLKFPFNQGESKVQPGFTFIYLCDEYVIARGAGGGLALWLRQDSE
ncbi:unnamed protein product [Discosporangium mesarthrocarpum]